MANSGEDLGLEEGYYWIRVDPLARWGVYLIGRSFKTGIGKRKWIREVNSQKNIRLTQFKRDHPGLQFQKINSPKLYRS